MRLFDKQGRDNWIFPRKKMNFDCYFKPYTKGNTKEITGLNAGAKTNSGRKIKQSRGNNLWVR